VNSSPGLRFFSLGLGGLIGLLVAALTLANSIFYQSQIEHAQAEGFAAAFESYFTGADTSSPDAGFEFLDSLKEKFQADWQVFLHTTSSANDPGAEIPSGTTFLNPDIFLRASTLDKPIYEAAQVYDDVLSGAPVINRVRMANEESSVIFNVYSFPIYDRAGTLIGVAEAIWDRSPQAAAQRNQLILNLATLAAIGLIALVGIMHNYRQAASPLNTLVEYSTRINQGEYSVKLPVTGKGTLNVLAQNLNSIAGQLDELTANLDRQVAERTTDLETRTRRIQTAADIASQIAAPHHLNDLLNTAVGLIRERFDYYHVGIFLVDDQKEFAVLKAANGETGNLLVQSGHKLGIGQSGIVGMVTAQGEPRIAADVTQDPAHYRNPILPYTRAEMALPLKAGGEVIGAIDVQSMEAGSFTQEDVSMLQTVADQLAVAVENTRLVEKLEASIQEANLLNKRQAENTWQHFTEQNQITGYEYDRLQVLPVVTNLPEDVQRQLISGQVVIRNSEQQTGATGMRQHKSTLYVPLILHEQLIGVIGIEQDQPEHKWTENELAIAQAAANQVSLTLENARLLEETHQRAERERIAGQITARMRVSNDPQQILQTAVSELKQALHAQKAQAWIAPRPSKPEQADPPSNLPGGIAGETAQFTSHEHSGN